MENKPIMCEMYHTLPAKVVHVTVFYQHVPVSYNLSDEAARELYDANSVQTATGDIAWIFKDIPKQ